MRRRHGRFSVFGLIESDRNFLPVFFAVLIQPLSQYALPSMSIVPL